MPEYLAYCIAQFQFSVNSFDKAFRRIVDTLPSYKSFLNLPGVYQHFHAVIVQMKKIVGKSAEKADLKVYDKKISNVARFFVICSYIKFDFWIQLGFLIENQFLRSKIG